jgi:hypothetical protein
MPGPISVIDIGPDGATATHPVRLRLPSVVAPVPTEQKGTHFNTIRPDLVAIACMRLPGHSFAFDSSLIHPSAEARFTKFANLMIQLKDADEEGLKRMAPVSVFGHADPTGKDAYNRMLSGRRAMAVYGLLVRDPAVWDKLKDGYGGDQWGKAFNMMLSTPLRDSRNPGAPPGPPFLGEAQDQKSVTAAVKEYQAARDITPQSGFVGDKTRKQLFLDYMDTLCHDEAGMPFKLDPETGFLARKLDKNLRGDVQGCGEFNPVLLLSAQQEKEFEPQAQHKARDEAYAEDRRVIVYAFRHGTWIDPAKWPCPTAMSEDSSACKKRFWSDADTVRLKRDPENERRFKETRDTMACRFYHGFAYNSPCEAGTRLWIVRFRFGGLKVKLTALKGLRYVLIAGDASSAPELRGTLDENGELKCPVFSEKTKMTLKLDCWKALFEFPKPKGGGGGKKEEEPPKPLPKTDATGKFADEDQFMSFELDAGELLLDSSDLASRQRLYNLGFGEGLPDKWDDKEAKRAVYGYQLTRKDERGLSPSGNLDGKTKEELKKEHELEGAPAPVDEEESQPTSV